MISHEKPEVTLLTRFSNFKKNLVGKILVPFIDVTIGVPKSAQTSADASNVLGGEAFFDFEELARLSANSRDRGRTC